MTDTPKVLGQSVPTNQVLTDLYTVGAATNTTVSSISVCNTAGVMNWFRVSVAPAGAADAVSQYLYRDVAIAGNDTFIATVGLTLAATDKIRVYQASGANCAFSAYGVEVT